MIGVYDSGVGGLSVWKELISLMPEKGYIYVADTAHCPYGEKPIDYIIERADKVSSFLISQGAKMVVVACNTATAAAINFLRNKGYSNFYGDLNAKDFGIPQNRERCFMVSMLGKYDFTFPKTIPLEKVMADVLEEGVPENFFISNEKAKKLIE